MILILPFVSRCLDGPGGVCQDNISKEVCLRKSANKKDYSYNDINNNFIKVSKELVILYLKKMKL